MGGPPPSSTASGLSSEGPAQAAHSASSRGLCLYIRADRHRCFYSHRFSSPPHTGRHVIHELRFNTIQIKHRRGNRIFKNLQLQEESGAHSIRRVITFGFRFGVSRRVSWLCLDISSSIRGLRGGNKIWNYHIGPKKNNILVVKRDDPRIPNSFQVRIFLKGLHSNKESCFALFSSRWCLQLADRMFMINAMNVKNKKLMNVTKSSNNGKKTETRNCKN